ncbi:uncharacterized protein [Onthophagus taurus]|uniref:uncharacterized protein n=1 Tax=Onthophagus taurus TaxID=166361 RepID=UPI0039BE493E
MMSHVIVSACNQEDSMKKSNNLFSSSLNRNQSENFDSLKLSILSYIRAVNKKNESMPSSRSRQHKQESDLNTIVSRISTEDSVHYIKRKRKSLVCQEKVVDNFTENVDKPSLDFTDDLPQKKQPRISTESEKYVEIKNLMTSADIKAIDDLLESLKTYRNIAELEDVADSVEVTQASLSTSINYSTEMIENITNGCIEPIVIIPPQQCKAKLMTHPNVYQKPISPVVTVLRESKGIIRKVISILEPFTIQIPPQCNVRVTIKHSKKYKDILPVVNIYSQSKHIKVISLPP